MKKNDRWEKMLAPPGYQRKKQKHQFVHVCTHRPVISIQSLAFCSSSGGGCEVRLVAMVIDENQCHMQFSAHPF